MRKYKFRGKRKNSGEWVYGWLFTLQHDQFVIYEELDVASSLSVWEFIKQHTYEVIPETVGQFTGHLDLNKKEIYTGDILQTKEWGIQFVAWDEENARFVLAMLGLINPECSYISFTQAFSVRFTPERKIIETSEIIGNIWDNPEIIEKEKG